MENQNQNTNTQSVVEQPLAVVDYAGDSSEMSGTDALSLQPTQLSDDIVAIAPKRRNPIVRLLRRVDVLLLAFLILGALGLVISNALHRRPNAVNNAGTSQHFGTITLPLTDFVGAEDDLKLSVGSVVINGPLRLNDGVVVAPSVQPNAPTAGQLYFDQNTNQLAYYNGSQYVPLSAQGTVVQSLGGASGALTLGSGLSVVNNQLTAAFPTPAVGVASLAGLTGDLGIGRGLNVSGSTLQSTGILTLTAGTPNLVLADDGNGNLTISSVGGGSGSVTSTGGTSGRIAKFTGVQNIEDSLLSESGSTVTVNGSLSVTGSLALTTALTVGNGGTGATSLPLNGVLFGQGTGAVGAATAAGAGQCLVSTAGAPAFQACPSGNGVTTLNGLTGALTIANATGSVNTITIDDASAVAKGLASFNATNFTVVGGAVNTAQNISTGSTPTFVGVNTNTITPSGALSIGTSAQALTLLGSASSQLSVTGGGQTTNVGFNGVPTGTVNYNFDRSATPGTYTICTTAANCAGVGGAVTTSGGTTNRLSKFTGAQSLGDSSLSDTGSLVTVNGTANLVVQGGTATLGTLSQAGTLAISDGSSNTVSIVAANLSADRVYTLPDAGGNASLCIDSGNCIGGSGSAPNTADYLVAALSGTLTNERALAAGSNVSLTDGGSNANFTVATVQNPTFTTSVTTPVLQSSGALTISSAAGQVVAIDAGTTIELQDSTNVTGALDVSAAFTAGTGNAFQISAAGAITAATGITSSGTIIFSGLNCTGNANGGALTTNGSGQLVCSDDDGGAGGAISGSGSSGTIPLFSGTNTITNSIITQSGTTVTVAGDLALNTALSVANGGTGVTSLTARGLLYGNGSGAVQVTAAGTGGQVVVADGSGVPTFVSFSGDVAVSATGSTTIQANAVALGTDTTGNYVANLGSLTGLTTTGNTGEGSTPTLSVTYGSIANTAVQGNITLTCPSGTGNLTGGGTGVTLGTGGACGSIGTVNNPTFTTSVTTPTVVLTGAGSNGSIEVGTLGQGTIYTLPDPGAGAATICISTGNCATAGTAGGDLTGSYPNPTIAKLQGTNLTIAGPAAGNILVYNATNTRWENHAVTGDIAISETGTATVQANAVALGTDTTGNYVLGVSAGTGASVGGSAGEGWTPTVSVLYGATAGTAVEGNTSISVSAGTNLTGGGSITLGAGGTVTLNVANSPTFSGTLIVQGATATVGTSSQQGSVVLNDGSSNTGTLQTAALGQNTTYTLPDPSAGTATICLSTGNCAGAGSGVTTTGGTTNRVSKFTGAQALGDSTISDDGTTVTINGTANLVVQGGTSTLGTLSQAGTLAISDGSSNTVSVVASALAADRVYTLPDAGGPASFCLSSGNCIGGGGGGAPSDATYLVTSLHGSLSNERSLNNGTNISFTDAGANGNFTIATVNNPTFSTSVTTPALQSSGALVISSAAGQTVAIDAGTTIELQDSVNVTGGLDVSASFTAGTGNAFQISSGGAITAATGITSSGTITFSGLNCTGNANGGALTTNGSGQLICSDDDGGAGGAISGSGSSGTIPVFNGTNSITNSIVTQSGTTITIAGDLVLNTALSVANGGTGATTFTSNGVLYGNGSGAVQVTAAGTGGQVLVADGSGVPTFVSFSGDVAVSNTGATTIQANSVALGTDTTGNYVATLGSLTGLSTTGNTGEGSTPTLSVSYGSGANTAVQGNVTLNCPSGTGNLTGGGTAITLGSGGSCGNISTVNNPNFTTSVTTPSLILTGAGSSGALQVANLGQPTSYTLPDPGVGGTANICLSTGNCTAIGTAGGDLTGSYPSPTIAKLQGGTLTITTVATGNILQFNGTAWVNQSISGDVALNSSAVATIQANAVNSGKIADGTIANADLSTGSFGNITGVGTLGALTVVGATSINASGTANTTVGNGTGTFQLTSNGGLNVSTGGALTGVSGITTSGGYTQSGATANAFTGASTFSAAGTALTVNNNATVSGTLTVNTITPNSALTVGDAGQSFTLQGSATSKLTATSGGNTTTVAFITPTANTTISFPALAAGTGYTVCTSSGNCGGVGATLQTAYDNSTNPEIVLDSTRGALTVRDNATPLAANLLEVQNNNGSTTYFNVTASGTNVTGTQTASGNINTTGGALQTANTDRINSSGNIVNIGTITTSGAINSQTISSTANFTGTLTVQGANALTLGTASSSTGAILFKGSGGAGTLTLAGPTTPSTFTLSLPAISADATVCTTNSICSGYQASGNYLIQAPTSTLTNTVTPTTTNVVGLTVNGTSGATSAAAAIFNQGNATSPADTVQINTTSTGSQTNALLVARNAGGGTTNNGINITNTAGTLTNGLAFTGTIGTDIARGSGTLTIQGTGTTAIGASGSSTSSSTIRIADTSNATGTQAVTIGSTANTANTLTLQGNTVTLQTNSSSGTVLVQSDTNSTNAFQVQDSGNQAIFRVDTTSGSGGAYFGTATTGVGTVFISTKSGSDSNLYLQSGSVLSSSNIQYALSKRANNTDFWLYGYDGTNFRNYLTTDWAANVMNLSSHGGTVNVGATGSSTASSSTNISNTTSGTGTQTVVIGSTANTANSTTLQGGTLTFSSSSTSAGALFRSTAAGNSTAAVQVQNSSNDVLFNMTTVAKTNTITNPGFETNTTAPWAGVNGGTITLSRVLTAPYAGVGSMQVAISTATGGAGAKYPVTLTNSTSYTLSMYVKSSTGVSALNMGYSSTGAGAGEIDCLGTDAPIYTTGWTRMSCTFTTPGSHSGSPYVYVEIPTSVISTFWVDNVQLTQTATDNGGYYAGQIDFSSSSINGQLTVQPSNDSTSAMQVFASTGDSVMQVDSINKQVVSPRFLATDDFNDPTRAFRIRTNGSGIDLEAAGGDGPGTVWMTGWSGTGNFGNGTQYTFFRGNPTLNAPTLQVGAGLGGSTPTLLIADLKDNSSADPSYGTEGAMYYNSVSHRFRCYQDGIWKNCVTTSIATGTSFAAAGSGNTTSASYVSLPSPSSLSFTKTDPDTKLVVTLNMSFYSTVNATTARLGVNIDSTDYDCTQFLFNTASEHTHVSCTMVLSGITSGSKTGQARWKRTSGTGTISIDANDSVMISVTETE